MGTTIRQSTIEANKKDVLEINNAGHELDILREKEGILHTFQRVHVKTGCKNLVKMFMRGRGFRTTNETEYSVEFSKVDSSSNNHTLALVAPNAHVH